MPDRAPVWLGIAMTSRFREKHFFFPFGHISAKYCFYLSIKYVIIFVFMIKI